MTEELELRSRLQDSACILTFEELRTIISKKRAHCNPVRPKDYSKEGWCAFDSKSSSWQRHELERLRNQYNEEELDTIQTHFKDYDRVTRKKRRGKKPMAQEDEDILQKCRPLYLKGKELKNAEQNLRNAIKREAAEEADWRANLLPTDADYNLCRPVIYDRDSKGLVYTSQCLFCFDLFHEQRDVIEHMNISRYSGGCKKMVLAPAPIVRVYFAQMAHFFNKCDFITTYYNREEGTHAQYLNKRSQYLNKCDFITRQQPTAEETTKYDLCTSEHIIGDFYPRYRNKPAPERWRRDHIPLLPMDKNYKLLRPVLVLRVAKEHTSAKWWSEGSSEEWRICTTQCVFCREPSEYDGPCYCLEELNESSAGNLSSNCRGCGDCKPDLKNEKLCVKCVSQRRKKVAATMAGIKQREIMKTQRQMQWSHHGICWRYQHSLYERIHETCRQRAKKRGQKVPPFRETLDDCYENLMLEVPQVGDRRVSVVIDNVCVYIVENICSDGKHLSI